MMLGSRLTLCGSKLIYKHDKEEPLCGIQTKEANIARSLMKRMTIEIKYMILERTPLPWLADVINQNDTKYLDKIKRLCQSSVVQVNPTNNSSYIVEFRKFVSSMKNIPQCEQCSKIFRRTNVELGGRMIDCLEMYTTLGERERYFKEASIEVDFTFLKSEPRLPNQGLIFGHSCVLARKPQLRCYLQLTNRTSVLSQRTRSAEEFETTENFIQIRRPAMFALDDNGYIYYHDGDQRNRRRRIYRKDLYTSNSIPQHVCDVWDGRMVPFVVGNNVLFLIHDGFVAAWDITTHERLIRQTPERGKGYISAHNKSVFFTTKDNRACVCTIKDGKLGSTILKFSRVLPFNRHSYFFWTNSSKILLGVVSIVNDEPIMQPVQFCDEDSVARRLSDNFFYVSTKREHCLYFQENYGAKPCLVYEYGQRERLGQFSNSFHHRCPKGLLQ